MIFGLPVSTFIWMFIVPILSIIGGIIYGVTFKDDDDWWTIDRLLRMEKGQEDDRGE